MKRAFLIILVSAVLCVTAVAAVARDGTLSAVTTSGTFSGTASGDLKLVFAARIGNATPPTLPSGWTSILTGTVSIDSFRLGCNVSSSSGDTGSGTWTNASSLVGISYSGTSVGTTVNCPTTGIGGTGNNGASASTSFNLPTITLTQPDWVAAFGGDNNQTLCAPTGMTSEATAGSTNHAIAMDTEGNVSSWPSASCTITSSTWLSAVVEILGPATVSSHFDKRRKLARLLSPF